MTLSILHRITGVAMSLGLIAFAAWLASIAAGGEAFDRFTSLMSSTFGWLLLIGWSFAFFLHLANGVRHLVWDVGKGFEIRHANASAWAVLVFAIALTIFLWSAL